MYIVFKVLLNIKTVNVASYSVKSCSPNAKKLSTLIITLHGYTVVWRMKSNQDIRFEIKDEVRSFCLPLVAAVATPLFSF